MGFDKASLGMFKFPETLRNHEVRLQKNVGE